MVASYDQLFEAWKGGLDWCNAGWLSDGTVKYPITKPREPCGGSGSPGLRSYGRQNKQTRFDVFCFASAFTGEVLMLTSTVIMFFSVATVQAVCLHNRKYLDHLYGIE